MKEGDYAKVKGENRVFKIAGFTKGRKIIPDGWLIDEDGFCMNPKFCHKYEGALSAIKQELGE